MNGLNSAMRELESLDQMVLSQLHEDMGEDIEEVLGAFLEAIDDLLASLKSRSIDESSETISRWAHSVKSSAASIGMMKLATIAATLEKKLKQGTAVDVDLLVSEIEHEYNLGRELLNNR